MLTIAKSITEYMISKKLTLSTAESCTGGLISAAFTSVPGSSAFFQGAVVAYDNRIKQQLLNVSEKTLIQYGAVSSQTVEEMALGACKLLKTDCAISVSGIAGPGGGGAEKPVGLVYIGINIKENMSSFRHVFPGSREQVRIYTVKAALCHLYSCLNNFFL